MVAQGVAVVAGAEAAEDVAAGPPVHEAQSRSVCAQESRHLEAMKQQERFRWRNELSVRKGPVKRRREHTGARCNCNDNSAERDERPP